MITRPRPTPPRRTSGRIAPLRISVDFVDWLACFASLTMLLLVQWTTTVEIPGLTMAVALLFLLPWAVVAVRQAEAALTGLLLAWPVLILPVLALLSTVWSDYPAWTLRASLEFIATSAVGVLAATCVRPSVFISALLSALTVAAMASALYGATHPWGPTGELVLVGVFGSKNYFGFVISLLMLTSVIVIFDHNQSLGVRIGAVISAILAAILLTYTRSIGAIICLFATLLCLGGLLLFTSLTRLGRITVLMITALVACFALVVGIAYADQFADILRYFGKNVTLTGRLYLWDRALNSIADNPAIGIGYQAFWQAGSWGAEQLWNYAGIPLKTGYHFHNTYLQVAVDLGFLGLFILVGTLLVMAYRTMAAFVHGARPEQFFAIAAFLFTLLRTPLEVDLFFQFQISSVLFCVAWIYLRPRCTRIRQASVQMR